MRIGSVLLSNWASDSNIYMLLHDPVVFGRERCTKTKIHNSSICTCLMILVLSATLHVFHRQLTFHLQGCKGFKNTTGSCRQQNKRKQCYFFLENTKPDFCDLIRASGGRNNKEQTDTFQHDVTAGRFPLKGIRKHLL